MSNAAESPALVFVGVATEDAIAVVKDYPAADERTLASEIQFAGGGPAATAAVAAARLGMRSALIAAVGDDAAGAKIVADLELEGVDTSGVQVISQARSARSVVIISGADKERAISNQPGPPLNFDRNEVARTLIQAADWVHTDQHGWSATRALIDSLHARPRLSVDAGNPIDGYRPRNTELYVPTSQALEQRYGRVGGPNDIGTLLTRAVEDGAELAVATSGSVGSYAFSRESGLVHADVPETELVSTLGAGDVFHGALLAAFAHAKSGALVGGLQAVIAYATVAASLSCRGLDGRSRIPDHAETMSALALMSIPKETDLPR